MLSLYFQNNQEALDQVCRWYKEARKHGQHDGSGAGEGDIHVLWLLDLSPTLQEMRMLPRSLSDCRSLTHDVMIQVSQFVSNSQLCH